MRDYEMELIISEVLKSQDSELPQNYFIHYHHLWVAKEGKSWVRIGLDKLMGKMIGHVKAVFVVAPGSRIEQGYECGAIELEDGGRLPIVAPISGCVFEVNPALRDDPDLICQDPLGDGYMMMVKADNFYGELPNLYWGSKAELWYKHEKREFIGKALESVLKTDEQARLGVTLHDGGQRLQDVREILGPDRHQKLLEKMMVRWMKTE